MLRAGSSFLASLAMLLFLAFPCASAGAEEDEAAAIRGP
jgi:hypothetical protein